MAVRHFAYTFDPQTFVEKLRGCVAADGRWLSDQLHACAKAARQAPSDAAREALIAVRSSDSWLSGAGDEADLAEKWLVLMLSKHLGRAPSLGRASPAPYVILKALLPGDVERLICGDSLASLVSVEFGADVADQLPALGDFGGWLSLAAIEALRDELERQCDPCVPISPEQRATLARVVPQWGVDGDTLWRNAFAAAQEMLTFALTQNKALFLVLD